MTIKLTKDKLRLAREYIMTKGRNLEQEIYKFHFENGSKKSVIHELERYQGENGGFKNLGEGERLFENAMDTNMAFQILHAINASRNEEIVQSGVNYIMKSYDKDLKYWYQNPKDSPVEYYMITDKWANPCAELIAYLHDYKELVPSNFLAEVTEGAMKKLSLLNKDGWFASLCFLRLADRLEDSLREKIIDKVKTNIFDIIETRKEIWSNEYCAKPFWYAPSLQSPLYSLLKEHVITCLENEILTQSDQGNFILNWEAGSGEKEWKSIVTMEVLLVLKNYDMISN
ncbi:hypothetical protein CN692_04090 [Bacillus sp. AFS002410]|uniref:hypothetical protein n=1 Tax=Bacillus sp. AFS002410 TaxID=2033481 RepID=UPI000BF212EE|nr:hypothetical protein [Bacillus sp. AFS002410]PEJ59966.1 hypothetical protein CN692_04090 [Bacillus sp. AFS002410]